MFRGRNHMAIDENTRAIKSNLSGTTWPGKWPQYLAIIAPMPCLWEQFPFCHKTSQPMICAHGHQPPRRPLELLPLQFAKPRKASGLILSQRSGNVLPQSAAAARAT